MSEEKEAIAEIEQEIEKTKVDNGLEIEIVDDKKPEEPVPEEKEAVKQEISEKEEYSQRVQRRINKLVDQRRETETELAEQQRVNKTLADRLSRLEVGSQHQAQNQFQKRYEDTKSALSKAIEEGDSKAQLDFTE